jgi:spoIIIJ-associated protein
MEWVETTGKTVEEALDAALEQLGVDVADAEYEVVEEAKTGLFGRLRAEARVRARVRPTTPRPKDERRGRGKRGSGSSSSSSSSAAASAVTSTDADAGNDDRASEAAPRRNPRKASSSSSAGGGGRRSTPAADPERSPTAASARPARAPRPKDDAVTAPTDHQDVPLAEQGELAAGFVRGFVERFGAPTAAVTVHGVDDETIEVRVEGEDLGLLIGPKGAALQSLQEITRTVVQRQTGARSGRILVDVSGYRAKRKEALERFARKIADDVLASATRVVLEPMNPADRKVIHDTINTIDGVSTSSEGEEPRRRVVVSPA